jgi:DNA relaxase NicK
LQVSVEDGRAVIRCGRCGVEQVLWTRVDLAVDGLAALFTEEHLRCAQARRRTD